MRRKNDKLGEQEPHAEPLPGNSDNPAGFAVSIPKRDVLGLTSIRGLAAWWVVIHHVSHFYPNHLPAPVFWVVDHGYVGVDLFFALSGYVIAMNYAGKLRHPSIGSWLSFLWLRLARVYPLHIFVLLLLLLSICLHAAFGHQGVPKDRFPPGQFMLNLVLMQNWGFTHKLTWNRPAWSISVEWLVYLLFPWLLFLSRKMFLSRAGCWAMIVASFGILSAFGHLMHPTGYAVILSYGPVRGVTEFWAGVSLFHLRRLSQENVETAPWLGLAAAGLCLGVSLLPGVSWYDFLPAGMFFVVYAVSFETGGIARVMNSRWLVYAGDVSYSTYMIHVTVIDYVLMPIPQSANDPLWVVPVCLAAIAVASVLLYRYMEMPARRALRQIDPIRLFSPMSYAGARAAAGP